MQLGGRHDASEAAFVRLVQISPVPFLLVRISDLRPIAVNDAFERAFGYSRVEIAALAAEEAAAVTVAAAAAPLVVRLEELAGILAQLEAAGEVRDVELHLRARGGRVHTALCAAVRVELDGEPHLAASLRDVTGERESEQRFAKAFEASPNPSVLVRLSDYRVIAINSAMERGLGYARGELVGTDARTVQSFVDPGMREWIRGELIAGRAIPELSAKIRTRAGEIRDVLSSVEIVSIDGEPHVLNVAQDVTERLRTERALRESEALLRELTEAIREVFWLADPVKREILYISPAYDAIWGRPRARLRELARDWLEGIHPEDRERVRAALPRQLTGEYDERYRVVRPDGTIRHIRDRAFPVRGPDGAVVRLAGLAEDITDLLALEEQLRQAQKLESLGLLASGIAHDFNNILAVIGSCAGILGEGLGEDHEGAPLVAEIDQAVARATALTRQLLAFSRKQVTEAIVLDLSAHVAETQQLLRRVLGEDIRLEIVLDPAAGRVRMDPGYLGQVLLNLAVNARDAMPAGGVLEIVTRPARTGEASEGPRAVLEVRDSGVGMPPELAARVFEPFFTTKPVGRGTGIGLAVVQSIIAQAGGAIEVESAPGRGTTFRIALPATTAPLPGAPSRRAAQAAGGAGGAGGAMVLIVDDDEYVRRAAARALRTRGYRVLEAASGEAALAHLASAPEVALVVTDVVMPSMNGRQLAERAAAVRPGLKFLYTSGHADDAVLRHGVVRGEVELIEKPFRVDALAGKVRQLLDA